MNSLSINRSMSWASKSFSARCSSIEIPTAFLNFAVKALRPPTGFRAFDFTSNAKRSLYPSSRASLYHYRVEADQQLRWLVLDIMEWSLEKMFLYLMVELNTFQGFSEEMPAKELRCSVWLLMRFQTLEVALGVFERKPLVLDNLVWAQKPDETRLVF